MDDIYFSNQNRDSQDSNNQGSGRPPQNEPGRSPKKQGYDNDVDIKSHSKRHKHKALISCISLLLLIAIVFGTGFGYVYSIMSNTNYNKTGHKDNVYVDEKDLASDNEVQNILLIGVDRRAADDASRSDTMMMLTIDKVNKKIKLTSFMRDMWVDIPDSGYAKLNAACTYGGAQLVMDTIEYNLNVKIDNYVLVDFDMFTQIVDKLGGVNVEVTKNESKYMSTKVFENGVPLNIKSGDSIHLNGTEALWYCRIRKLDSDFMRTFRQRKVLTSILTEVKDENLFDLKDMVVDILPSVETDLSPLSLAKLAFGTAFSYIRYDVEQAQIPADDMWKSATKKGQDVLLADLDKNSQFLKDFLYSVDKKDSKNEDSTSK